MAATVTRKIKPSKKNSIIGKLILGGSLGMLALIVLAFIFGPSRKEVVEYRRVTDSTAQATAASAYNDSMAVVKVRMDSTARVERVKDSVEAVAEKKRAAAERRALLSAPKPRYDPNEIHVGPRGGRYTLGPNGEQRYLKKR